VGGAVQYFAAEGVVSAEHRGHVPGPHIRARVVVEALQQGTLFRAADRIQKIARQRTRRCPVVVAAQYLAHRRCWRVACSQSARSAMTAAKMA
jgi:hypothetical protein